MPEVLGVHQQRLAAPQGAVVAQTHAVQGQADGRAKMPVFGQDRMDVREMVLKRQAGQAGLAGEGRAQEVRMQVVDHGIGSDLQDVLEMGLDFAKKP